ncbi:MAG: bifunctional oligoribonuclease/PAP phosphatase NrnA [Halobacteria archaeon]|nr:bifunctional oligoribonuclease/PAP phosphatase NrnA [Halobacteria archaeon]
MTDSLVDVLRTGRSLAVVCHDNPDPDCIASALSLRRIAEEEELDVIEILYGGDISHQQNRAFVNLLGIEMQHLSESDVDAYDLVAFVDHSVPGANNSVPEEVDVDIVIDHHPLDDEVEARYVDRRTEYGATTTLLVEYLRELGIEPDTDLATALLFAIRRETLNFLRDTTPKEYDAARYLHPLADKTMLREMVQPAFTPATLDTIGEAIRNREVRASALISGVGRTTERDALPQCADYLMNLEGVATVVVFGIVNDDIHISARSNDSRINLDDVMREAFGDVGSAGGHHDMAGAQIPLGIFSDLADSEEYVDLASEIIERRFFDAMNLSATTSNGNGE